MDFMFAISEYLKIKQTLGINIVREKGTSIYARFDLHASSDLHITTFSSGDSTILFYNWKNKPRITSLLSD